MPSMTISIRPLQLRRLGTFLAVLCLGGAAFAQTAHFSGIVNTVGSGFIFPLGVAVDANGDVFVADDGDYTVKEIVAVNGQVSSTSTVITVASGFAEPYGVALDASGDVFVGDAQNNAVKEIVAVNGHVSSSSAVIPVGSGFRFPTGVAVDASGDVFVGDYQDNALKEIVAVNGKVSSSSTVITVFAEPVGVAVDASGDVFIGELFPSDVKEILAVDGQVSSSSTVITLGSGFHGPTGVALDASGDVFVADNWNNAVKEIVAVNGQVSSSSAVITLGSGFFSPTGVAVDASGDVLVADQLNGAVKEIELAAANFGTVNVGSASATTLIPFRFDSAGTPSGWKVFTQGAQGLDFTEVTGSTTCSTATDYAVGAICSVAVRFSPRHPGLRMGAVQLMDASGNVIATAHLRGIGSGPQVVFPSNDTPSVVGSEVTDYYPFGVAVDASGDVFFAEGVGVREIVAVNGQVSSGSTVITVGSGFSYPTGVAVDASGDVFVADFSNNAVDNAVREIVAVNGQVSSSSTVKTVGSGFRNPKGVAVDANGNVFVADWENGVKEIVAVNGQVSSSSTVITVGSGFNTPTGVAVDANGDVFVADRSAVKEIVAVNGQVSSTSTVITVGSGFGQPWGVAVDASGNVFVADAFADAVKEIMAVNGQVSSTSTVITLDSGFWLPRGVAVDASGDVFVADTDDMAVKEIPLATPPSLSFAATAVGSTSSDSPQTVQIQNDGNADLTFTGVSYPTDFPSAGSGTNPCNGATVLSAGDECDLVIDFSPLNIGTPLSEHVTLTDNAPNAAAPGYATQSISLSGTTPIPAALTSPTGTTLTGSSQTFTWSAGAGVTSYAFRVGTTGGGSRNIYNSGSTMATSATVNNIPTDGGTVYVGVSSEINGVWQFTGYTFLESGGPPIPAALTAPTGTTLAGSSQTFTWTVGAGVADYELWVGTTNASSSNIYRSGWLTATSATVNNIPTSGGRVFVRLCSMINGTWQFTDYTFTESGGPPVKAALTSPTVTTLTGSSQTFTWSAGVGVSKYELRVGTTGYGSRDIYNSGSTTATSALVNNIPTNGGTVYVGVSSQINGVWHYAAYTFNAQ